MDQITTKPLPDDMHTCQQIMSLPNEPQIVLTTGICLSWEVFQTQAYNMAYDLSQT
jgi:hypothetical protein